MKLLQKYGVSLWIGICCLGLTLTNIWIESVIISVAIVIGGLFFALSMLHLYQTSEPNEKASPGSKKHSSKQPKPLIPPKKESSDQTRKNKRNMEI